MTMINAGTARVRVLQGSALRVNDSICRFETAGSFVNLTSDGSGRIEIVRGSLEVTFADGGLIR